MDDEQQFEGKKMWQEKKEPINYLWIAVFLSGIVVGYFTGAIIVTEFSPQGNSLDSNTLKETIYSGTECALRNTETIFWIPDMQIGKDSNGQLQGIPICVPFNKITGQRLKIN